MLEDIYKADVELASRPHPFAYEPAAHDSQLMAPLDDYERASGEHTYALGAIEEAALQAVKILSADEEQ